MKKHCPGGEILGEVTNIGCIMAIRIRGETCGSRNSLCGSDRGMSAIRDQKPRFRAVQTLCFRLRCLAVCVPTPKTNNCRSHWSFIVFFHFGGTITFEPYPNTPTKYQTCIVSSVVRLEAVHSCFLAHAFISNAWTYARVYQQRARKHENNITTYNNYGSKSPNILNYWVL